MKQLTCEMCGGTNLIKDGGVFVCQTCGCKYSIEEAKRMMMADDGAIAPAQATVKVDNTDFVQKYLINARRAKEKEDWEETEKYYNMVEQNDPQNIEAIFYSSYGKAKTTLVDADFFKREAAFKVLQNCISILDDNFTIEREEENKPILEQISKDIRLMACSEYVYTQHKNGYGIVVSSDKMKTVTLFNNLSKEFMVAMEHIAQKYPDDQKEKRIYFYNLALIHTDFVLQNGSLANPTSFRNVKQTYEKWINDIQAEQAVKAWNNYWAEHAEEKNALESEKASLQRSLNDYAAEMDNLPGMADKKYFEGQVFGLKQQISDLGLFKGKEKKALQAQVDEYEGKLRSINASMQSGIDAVQAKINAAWNRINAIDAEFAKDRF